MDWSNLYTYYSPPLRPPSSSSSSPPADTPQTVQIDPAAAPLSIPVLPATFVPPDTPTTTTNDGSSAPTFAVSPVSSVITARDAHRAPFAALVDPFAATHVYSGGLLPISASLKLAEPVIQAALDKMTAFFRAGPLLVTPDLDAPAAYVPANQAKAPGEGGVLNPARVGVPGFGSGGVGGKWSWLQPYYVPPVGGGGGAGGAAGGSPDQYTQFMGMQVGNVDATAKFLAGPYAALEGYLQLEEPLLSAEGVAPATADSGPVAAV
jgi:hypothetical protein